MAVVQKWEETSEIHLSLHLNMDPGGDGIPMPYERMGGKLLRHLHPLLFGEEGEDYSPVCEQGKEHSPHQKDGMPEHGFRRHFRPGEQLVLDCVLQ